MNREDYESNQDWHAKCLELEERVEVLEEAEGVQIVAMSEEIGNLESRVKELDDFIDYLFDSRLVLGHGWEEHWNEFKKSSSHNVDVSPDNRENQ